MSIGYFCRCSALCALIAFATCARADDTIEGVQAAALDQPRIYLNLQREPKGAVLRTEGAEPMTAVEAFLDTGASGIMLSEDTIKKLRIQAAPGVIFEDVGVAGAEEFKVTEPLYVSAATYPKSDPETANYAPVGGPFRMQIKPGGGILEMIAPGLDVLGMPALAGRVIVLDPRPLKDFDKIKTSLLEPGDRSIPKTSRTVQLTGVSFAKFTRVKPAGAAGPNVYPNPMIGPDPFKPGDTRKPVIVRHGGNEVKATFLLDTGAAASIISSKLATDLGLRIGANGALENVPKDRQFQLAIGGLGGAKNAAGTFFECLEIPTREGPPIVYAGAPLLVSDITVVDAEGKPFTIDGILGMNYLVASAEITGGLLPDVGKLVGGPWKWIVIDLKQGTLGLEPQQIYEGALMSQTLAPFRVTTDLNDVAAIQQRLDEDGYIFVRGAGPRDKILNARRAVLEHCAAAGWLDRSADLMAGIWSGVGPFTEGEAEYMAVYREVLHTPAFVALPADSVFMQLMQSILGGQVLLHRRRIGRITFPNNVTQTTGAHQDFQYIRGDVKTYTIWLPLGDCPIELGGLAVLPGSHRLGFLEHRFDPSHKYAGHGLQNEQLPANAQWVAGDFEVGDFLVFHSHTVHKSLPNVTTDRLRVSADNRYQLQGTAIEPGAMGTHYNL